MTNLTIDQVGHERWWARAGRRVYRYLDRRYLSAALTGVAIVAFVVAWTVFDCAR